VKALGLAPQAEMVSMLR